MVLPFPQDFFALGSAHDDYVFTALGYIEMAMLVGGAATLYFLALREMIANVLDYIEGKVDQSKLTSTGNQFTLALIGGGFIIPFGKMIHIAMLILFPVYRARYESGLTGLLQWWGAIADILVANGLTMGLYRETLVTLLHDTTKALVSFVVALPIAFSTTISVIRRGFFKVAVFYAGLLGALIALTVAVAPYVPGNEAYLETLIEQEYSEL